MSREKYAAHDLEEAIQENPYDYGYTEDEVIEGSFVMDVDLDGNATMRLED